MRSRRAEEVVIGWLRAGGADQSFDHHPAALSCSQSIDVVQRACRVYGNLREYPQNYGANNPVEAATLHSLDMAVCCQPLPITRFAARPRMPQRDDRDSGRTRMR